MREASGVAASDGSFHFRGEFTTMRASHTDPRTYSCAKDIKHVLNFYKDRFDIDMSGSQRDDLKAFLLAL